MLAAVALFARSRLFSRLALVWILFYMSVGISQRERAESAALQLATSRGHTPVRIEVKPGFGSLVLWKSVYEAGGRFYVDGIRVFTDSSVLEGESVAALDVERDLPWLEDGTQQSRDLARFQWFSKNYTALRPGTGNQVFDVRYSVLPNEIETMWLIKFDAGAKQGDHVEYDHLHQNTRDKVGILWQMINGSYSDQ